MGHDNQHQDTFGYSFMSGNSLYVVFSIYCSVKFNFVTSSYRWIAHADPTQTPRLRHSEKPRHGHLDVHCPDQRHLQTFRLRGDQTEIKRRRCSRAHQTRPNARSTAQHVWRQQISKTENKVRIVGREDCHGQGVQRQRWSLCTNGRYLGQGRKNSICCSGNWKNWEWGWTGHERLGAFALFGSYQLLGILDHPTLNLIKFKIIKSMLKTFRKYFQRCARK